MIEPIPDDVADRCVRIFCDGYNAAAEDARSSTLRRFAEFGDEVCESPIEALMLAALAYDLDPLEEGERHLPLFFRTGASITVQPQRQIGPYRVDFAIEERMQLTNARSHVRIAVECDGHDFHQKTREQAERDKARDRYLTTEGWLVLRFTGREIVRDPRWCAERVQELIDAQHGRNNRTERAA